MAENYLYHGLLMVLMVGRLRQEDNVPFNHCMSGFGSGDTKITRAGKCAEENGLSLEHVAFKALDISLSSGFLLVSCL